ncbi:hypothetical protein VIGAN_09015300 [Vigna angularis var. angularis]|uniref:non-specific serine/threonine protein kinase n=2 Tax=Phaseolus angularis TaxID=3914 RepID=A0A0S3SVE5_PHAAN|nr:uncharacterized protein LOC108346336 [Vigna angularis]XP_017440888.1 uncharacterized protein LOC108346336 [Vigna angularis]BAT96845.1 hypothetical protein VIGAN_09015300 [Vigna angularis var. angularis]
MAECEFELDLEEKSWHLFALLLRIGHAVYPSRLAAECRLFAASPDFVCYVSSLSGSPLSVTDNGLVTPSVSAVFALGSFFSVRLSPERQTHRFRKRKLLFDSAEDGIKHKRLAIGNGIREISFQSCADAAEALMRRNFPIIKFESQNIGSGNFVFPLRVDKNEKCSGYLMPNFKHRHDISPTMSNEEVSKPIIKNLNSPKLADVNRFMACNLRVDRAMLEPSVCKNGIDVNSFGFGKKMDCFDAFTHDSTELNSITHVASGTGESNVCKNLPGRPNEDDEVQSGSKKGLVDTGSNRDKEDVTQMVNAVLCGEELTNGLQQKNSCLAINLETMEGERNIITYKRANSSLNPKRPLKSSSTLKGGQKKNGLHPKSQILKESPASNKCNNVPQNVDQFKNNQKLATRKQNHKENKAENIPATTKVEKKAYPSFEAFTIEEEEGSGGYGTVYRAQRTTDGKRVAIKCPHSNAHINHVTTERNMLERFGGKNFIIRYEGSLKNNNTECFVLEHVEHERPEVLKKEIDLLQIQWYGYCLFRALYCLHKEGVVHRDVKPGNFLFSRKQSRGYLIDFNLAMDLKQKNKVGSKSKPNLVASSHNVSSLSSRSAPLVRGKNLGGSKSLTSNKRALADYKNYSELNRHVKQKAFTGPQKNRPDMVGGSFPRAQGTDGSGITSARDASTRTASAERLREPLPSHGRKELISFVNTMKYTNNSSITGPSSQRKRVTAPSSRVDSKIFHITPMPLHSSTVGAVLRSKGDGKQKKEGSCVGTKGFRAPEVLLRSQHQGHKIDIWSAGVTLLYMVIGKTPFTGDPEQNIKEIVKLRGSEEFWEVAKLHNREVSFPEELLDERYLQSWDLGAWCKTHTKRPEFLEQIPKSLFDLIDKCLTVNPRNRLSAEDVLRHQFFDSLNDSLRKQRMMQRAIRSEAAAASAAI